MKRRNWLIILPLVMLSGVAAAAEAPAPPLFDPAKDMRVAQVRPGMRGYGLSVFRGTKIARFKVRVVSVLHNFNPKSDGLGPNTDIVLVRCSGQNLEHTGAIEGMSGSPIYLKCADGQYRIIGAFAYGWPMAKDPIGGVQPIEQMLKLSPQPNVPATEPATQSTSEAAAPITWSYTQTLARLRNRLSELTAQPNRLTPFDAGGIRLRPLATPIAVSGMPAGLLSKFSALFGQVGMTPMQTMSSGASNPQATGTLVPGSVLAVPLLTGDMSLTAIGTCTDVIGKKVFGFGHAFNDEGAISLPMAGGDIDAVIANMMTSFKIGSATKILGTLNTDELYGVAGELGAAPRMIPMTLHVIYADGSENHVYRLQMVNHPRFTPLIGSISIAAAVSATRNLPEYYTLDYDLKLDFANGQQVHLLNEMVNADPTDIMFSIGTPMMMAAENPFKRVMVKSISGTLRITPEARQAKILSVQVPKEKYKPGDTVKGYVTYRPFRGTEAIVPVEMQLPHDLEEGTYDLEISDSQKYLQMEQATQPFRFTAQSVKQVFAVLQDLAKVKRNAIYLRLVRNADGVAVGRTAMPNMPSSQRQVMLDAGRSDITPFVSSKVVVIPMHQVMQGSASFQITVKAPATVESAAGVELRPRHTPEPPGAKAPGGKNSPDSTPPPTPDNQQG